MGNCTKKPSSSQSTSHTTIKRSLSFSRENFIKEVKGPLTDRYTILETIGQGAFGKVMLAEHISTGSKRAIKTIQKSQIQNLKQLTTEISTLKKLNHPNIIRIHEIVSDKHSLNIVMEHCTGGELFQRIESAKNFSEHMAAGYMFDLVSAIKYCHSLNLIHRDIKPENILFENERPDARLKLIDFGTSVFFQPMQVFKKFIGTAYYVAPEVIDQNYNEKCDVWSLGIIMYVMLCGRPPFIGNTDEETLRKIQKVRLSFKGEIWEGVSQEAKALLQQMLMKKPEKRISIDEVFADQWVQGHINSRQYDAPLAHQALSNLHAFSAEYHLKKFILHYIMHQMLTHEEIDKLRKIFEKLDRNNNQHLCREDLIEGFKEIEVEDVDVDKILEKCSSDKNGKLSYSDFLAAAYSWQHELSLKQLEITFKDFDRNGDGRFCVKDLEAVLGDSVDPKLLKEMIGEIESKILGEIDYEEFLHFMIYR